MKGVKSLGVEYRIVFMGYASDEELRAAYRLASAVVLPSRIEGFGITVLEGWINRKPVVVSMGASELVEDGVNGYTFEPGREDQLADGISKATGPSAEHLGDNGAETVKQCLVGEASKHVKTVLEETVESFV